MQCIYCAQTVPEAAKKCFHCSEWIIEQVPKDADKPKDAWDKWEALARGAGLILIPVVLAVLGFIFQMNYNDWNSKLQESLKDRETALQTSLKDRETTLQTSLKTSDGALQRALKKSDVDLKLVEVAVSVLQSEPKPEKRPIRGWAIDLINARVPDVKMNPDVRESLLHQKLAPPYNPFIGSPGGNPWSPRRDSSGPPPIVAPQSNPWSQSDDLRPNPSFGPTLISYQPAPPAPQFSWIVTRWNGRAKTVGTVVDARVDLVGPIIKPAFEFTLAGQSHTLRLNYVEGGLISRALFLDNQQVQGKVTLNQVFDTKRQVVIVTVIFAVDGGAKYEFQGSASTR